jgi:hypothetical protein
MFKDLSNNRSLIDKTDQPHLRLTMGTDDWINFPYFLDTLTPHYRRDSFTAMSADIHQNIRLPFPGFYFSKPVAVASFTEML